MPVLTLPLVKTWNFSKTPDLALPKELGPERYATLDGTTVLSYVLFGCISFSQTWYSSTKVVEKRRGEHAQVDGGTR